MKTLNLIFFIICCLVPIAMIAWKIYKVHILAYVSRWDWGVKLMKQVYFNTMFNREKNRVRSVQRAVKMAKMKNKAENLKQYVIEVRKGLYWYGTLKEFNVIQKENPRLRGIWPPKDAVFQTN